MYKHTPFLLKKIVPRSPPQLETAVQKCIHQVLSAMELHLELPKVVRSACAALANLTHDQAANCRMVVYYRGANLVATAMNAYLDDTDIQLDGSRVLLVRDISPAPSEKCRGRQNFVLIFVVVVIFVFCFCFHTCSSDTG